MKYQWVLFDADETLFHFDNFAGLKHMFAKHGVKFEQTDFDQYQALNKPLWVDYQNGQISAEQLQTRRFQLWSDKLAISTKELNRQFLDSMAEICKTLPGAEELVAYLHANNIKMGIITNGFAQLQKIRLERTGFLPYFSPVVISERVGVAKPHPKIFEYTLELMGSPDKNHVLMVGDTLESDILGGNHFGFDTCWLNHHNKTHPEEIRPTYQVSSLNELLNRFKYG
ncbi:pyrimidine 5'-nucleotidase [Marinomonas sp. M1K-6]|uniref:Pyrimidine 5'-nucleotidase n=1 Tax=Marinomonas profundi TaxID=2726122 RepID=A0A847R5T9_9GAMM|nr:pyrimidine 5'-nucleotidase [Marinomonas profundi]NLQ16417.1 pyrimidine 5'-nucleotidase [Marinomonas profundi]UDV03010.1 pyrimidine 5'-nucleotidase [Marinomonas profundi]